MDLRTFCVASLLLPLSGFVAADAYKCEPRKGVVSYQQYSCPKSVDQAIVRIHGNSHHVDYNAQAEPHPWLAKLLAIDKEQALAIRVRNAKRAAHDKKRREETELAVLMEQREKCDKFTALYHERVRLQGVLVTDTKTGKSVVNTSAAAQEMIESTRATMESHCGTTKTSFQSAQASNVGPLGSQLIY